MLLRRILPLLALSTFGLLGFLHAAPPVWWTDPDTRILAPDQPAHNYAPANVGQLKNFAVQAKKALDIQLASVGGAGPELDALVASFEPRAGQSYTPAELTAISTANHSPVNLGQVKNVAKVFYARLKTAGYNARQNLITRGYPAAWAYDLPWDPNDPVYDEEHPNYAIANLGQLKMVFSFDLTGFDADSVDFDGDGLTNREEFLLGTSQTNPDTDGDGLSDGDEVHIYHTDPRPNHGDTDGDDMPDGWEVRHGLNPLFNDAWGDLDHDGLKNIEEYWQDTDPQLPDTDGDGLNDGDEVHVYSTLPLVRDSDGDGLEDGAEVALGTSPNDPDTDRDGAPDGVEKAAGTDPTSDTSYPPVWKSVMRELAYYFYYRPDPKDDVGSLNRTASWRMPKTVYEPPFKSAISLTVLTGRLQNLDFPATVPADTEKNAFVTPAHSNSDPNCPHTSMTHRRYWLEMKPAPAVALQRTVLIETKRTIDNVDQTPTVRSQTVTIPAGQTASESFDVITTLTVDSSAKDNRSENTDETLLPVEMMVDANRDGEMDFANASIHDKDGTTAEKPYRFWLNDDQDVETHPIQWSDPDPETIPVVTRDYSDSQIQGTRDLEDFTRLWISFKGITEMVKSSGFEIKLEWKPNDGSASWPSDAGNPGIKVYKAVEADGGRKYIEDQTWANQQVEAPYKAMLADVHKGTPAVLPLSPVTLTNLTETNPNVYLLFEGSSEGKGQLVLTLHKGGQKIGEYPPLFLDIKNIKKMYMRGHTTPLPANFPFPYDQGSPPSFPYVAAQSGALFIPYANVNYGLGNGAEAPTNQAFEKPADEEKKCIVLVHGIDMDIDSYHSYVESGFKRFWWAGYKGRFCAFRWGTPLSSLTNIDIFNDGEMRAWSYGPSLIGYVGYMQGQMPGARISVIGHSLGNAVVSSAFEQGLVVDSYVAMEAAVSLSCYYPPATQGQADPLASPSSYPPDLAAAEASKPTPNNYSELGYRGFLRNLPAGIQGKVTAYQNQRDFWLATGTTSYGIKKVDWVSNQKSYKPNDLVGPKAYEFHPDRAAGQQVVLGIFGLNNDRLVQDPHESMAYVARSRTPALGAEPPNRNPRPPNWAVSVDMESVYNFNSPRFDHSGQFQRNIQLMYWDTTTNTPFATPFYRQLMEDLRVQPQ